MLMAMRRTQTMKFGEFMSGEYKHRAEAKKRKIKATGRAVVAGSLVVTAGKVMIPAMLVTVPVLMATKSVPAMVAADPGAAVPVVGIPNAVKEKIIHAFDPLIDLMVGLSIPIAGVMITGGALMILIGQKDTGFKWIMNAALGYVLVQLSPMLINLLIGVGAAV